jgi:hypothetical protein
MEKPLQSVCQRNALRRTYIGANPHDLAFDNLKIEHFKLEQLWNVLTVFDTPECVQLTPLYLEILGIMKKRCNLRVPVRGYHKPGREDLRQYTYCAKHCFDKHRLRRLFRYSNFYLLSFYHILCS